MNDLSKPVQVDVVDCSSGILIPYYDQDTNIVFVAGKGDGNIRYYEITDGEPYIHYLSEYKSSSPQRGLGWMPKRGLDVTKNEIFRFYKLHATGGMCEPISMIVPRKSEVFQEDIYPDTISGIPSLSCDEWISGANKEPILMSLKDGAVPFMPKIVTYKQLGFSELGPNLSRSLLNPNPNKPKQTTPTTYYSKNESSSSSSSQIINGPISPRTPPHSHGQHSLDLITKPNLSWSPSSQTCSSETTPTVIFEQQRSSKLVMSARSAFSM